MFNNIPAKKKHNVNYGFGNLVSVANTIEFLGFESGIINNPEKLSSAITPINLTSVPSV